MPQADVPVAVSLQAPLGRNVRRSSKLADPALKEHSLAQPATSTIRPWAQCIVGVDAAMRQLGWPAPEIARMWRTHELMERLFAGVYRGSGRPFVNHLAGTAALMLRYGGTSDEVCAAYAHAAYSQGDFGSTNQPLEDKRPEVVTAMGTTAEDLVASYARFASPGMTEASEALEAVGLLGPIEQQVLLLRTVNALEGAFDWGVQGDDGRARCLDRLQTGSDLARVMNRLPLADDLMAIHATLLAQSEQPSPMSRPQQPRRASVPPSGLRPLPQSLQTPEPTAAAKQNGRRTLLPRQTLASVIRGAKRRLFAKR